MIMFAFYRMIFVQYDYRPCFGAKSLDLERLIQQKWETPECSFCPEYSFCGRATEEPFTVVFAVYFD